MSVGIFAKKGAELGYKDGFKNGAEFVYNKYNAKNSPKQKELIKDFIFMAKVGYLKYRYETVEEA